MPLTNLSYNDLVKLHGKSRLEDYLGSNLSSSKEEALFYYKENVDTSLSFWQKIQFIEVALRNKIVEEWKVSVKSNNTINLDWSTLHAQIRNTLFITYLQLPHKHSKMLFYATTIISMKNCSSIAYLVF